MRPFVGMHLVQCTHALPPPPHCVTSCLTVRDATTCAPHSPFVHRTARRWVDAHGLPPYDTSSAAAPPPPTRRQLLDRESSHTAHCIICQSALATAQRIHAAAKLMGAAAFLAACALLGTWGPEQLLAGGKPSVLAAAVVAVGLAAAAVARRAAQEAQRFIYEPFSHADNH